MVIWLLIESSERTRVKGRKMNRTNGIARLCVFTYDESQTTRNDLLLLIHSIVGPPWWIYGVLHTTSSWAELEYDIMFQLFSGLSLSRSLVRSSSQLPTCVLFNRRKYYANEVSFFALLRAFRIYVYTQIFVWSKYHLHNASIVMQRGSTFDKFTWPWERRLILIS